MFGEGERIIFGIDSDTGRRYHLSIYVPLRLPFKDGWTGRNMAGTQFWAGQIHHNTAAAACFASSPLDFPDQTQPYGLIIIRTIDARAVNTLQ